MKGNIKVKKLEKSLGKCEKCGYEKNKCASCNNSVCVGCSEIMCDICDNALCCKCKNVNCISSNKNCDLTKNTVCKNCIEKVNLCFGCKH